MIRAFDYRPVYLEMREDIDAAVERVLASGRLILGPEVEAFEAEFAAWLGTGHAVGVGSGTDALALALRALDVGPGDEVLTVANAGAPPVAAIRQAGARPVFADVAPDTLCMDPALVEAALTPRVRCLLPVHLYGRPAPMKALLEIAGRRGIPVVEDCAQAHGGRREGVLAGTSGSIGCFSFYPTKNLGAFGDGGACVTSDEALARRLRRLRFYGQDGSGSAVEAGWNSRLDELQAAILRVLLSGLDRRLAERRSLARSYRQALAPAAVELPAEEPGVDHAYHLYVVRVARRAELIAALEAAEIGHGIHYRRPAHRMPAYATDPANLPVTEAACREVLSLPLYPGLAAGDVESVARAVRDATT